MGTPFIQHDPRVLSAIASTDLTSFQWKAVELYDDGNTLWAKPSSGTAGFFGGIVENIPASGSGASVRVCVFGMTKAVASAAMTSGSAFVFGGINNTATGEIYPISSSTGFTHSGTTNSVPAFWVSGYTIGKATAASQVVTVFINQNWNIS